MWLYIDLSKGVSQDMLIASLIGHMNNKNDIMHELNDYMPKNIHLTLSSAKSYENEGLMFNVKNDDYKGGCHHSHGYMYSDVLDIIKNSQFNESTKTKALDIYKIIASAESAVHEVNLDKLHFHEVGSPRAIYTILSTCFVYEKLNLEKVICSPINLGYGTVVCAHGEVEVPAPATKKIVKDMPEYTSHKIKGELVTPTGASLIKYFCNSFAQMEIKDYISKSIGIGSRDIGEAGGVISYILE